MSETELLDDLNFQEDNSNIASGTKKSHDRNTFLHAVALLFGRICYFGICSILVIYSTDEILLPTTEAYPLYTYFLYAVLLFEIVGGLLGDSQLGNKKTTLLGCAIQVVGAFSLCHNTEISLYLGLSLIAIGSGIFLSNIRALFGKNYFNKIKVLDAGFMIFYIALNISAFLATFIIGSVGTMYGWNYGFIIAGICGLISLTIVISLKDQSAFQVANYSNKITQNHSIIIAFVLMSCLFAIFYDAPSVAIYQLLDGTQTGILGLLPNNAFLFQNIFILALVAIAAVGWTRWYSSQRTKMIIAFFVGTIAIGFLVWVPNITSNSTFSLIFLILFIHSVGDLFLTPVVHSITIQYANPKHLTLILSLVGLPSYFLMEGLHSLDKYQFNLNENPIAVTKVAFLPMAIITIILLIYHFKKKGATADLKI